MDDKIKFVEIKYKLEGFAIVVKLMQRIYSQGYWCKWTEDELLLFTDEIKGDIETVKNVVGECLDRGFFNKKLYDNYKILTSNGIQKRYKEIVRRRKDVEMIPEYTLIDGNFGVNDDINPSVSKQDDSKSTQSKVKETKVNQTKEQIPYVEIIEHLNKKAGKSFKAKSRKTKEVIAARWSEGHRLNDFKRVIDFCCEKWSGQIFSNGKKGDDYLQPSTLFNGKFDERLNWTSEQKVVSITKSKDQIEHEKMLAEMGYNK